MEIVTLSTSTTLPCSKRGNGFHFREEKEEEALVCAYVACVVELCTKQVIDFTNSDVATNSSDSPFGPLRQLVGKVEVEKTQ